MNKTIHSLVVFFVCSVMTSAVFASGFQLNEHGARAMAQGGAFAARATDGSAIFFNPAGLAFQTRPSLYAGTTLISPVSEFYGPTQLNTNQKSELQSQLFTPINIYFSYPIMEGLTAAVGVNNPFGLGTKWNENWAGKYLTTKVYLETFFISPTLAYQITDQLAIGAGVNYVTGSVLIERAVFTGAGDPRVSLDLSASGWGFNVGAMYKITPELSIGASYRSTVKVDAKGTAKFTPALSVLPAGDATTKIKLPAVAFVGLAYKVSEELELEADYQYNGWSSYDELAIEFKSNNSKSVAPKNYQDSFILRFGGEYKLDALRLRAGYLYDKSPVKDQFVEPMLPDANRNGINVGFGYNFNENFSLDFAYLLLLFNERKVESTIPEINFDGTYKSYVNLFAIDFGYTF
ncbi:MAG: outer membrane protein transport protein [Ignavibacteriae bacterium]|nr:outer membrane protein transport protein [Ignavibacteriota bacterium]